MKNYKSFVIAILGIVSMVSICQAVSVEWVRQSDSPVLDTGGPSPYESYHVSYPSVLIQDEIYKMWYAGYRAGPSPRGGICYATSTDKGLTWTKHGTVLEVTEEWEQNSPPETYNYVNYPRVIYEEGMYKMWYNATGLSRGYATSTDGINWDNKTQQLGHGYAYAEVVKGPSDYKLYYNKSGGIYVMESNDGGVSDPWEVANQDNPVLELGGLGEWDSLAVLQPNVRYDPGTGKFQMWYRGSATPSLVPSKIGFALSDDGLTWEKCLANPILEPIAGTWERDAVWPGSTVFDHTDNTYRMFYGGYHFDHQAIGLATAVPEPACWTEIFFDDFDDGNFDGWSATNPKTGESATAPEVVPSPEGYSLKGVGSGYSQDPGLNVYLTYPLVISNAVQLKVEMRAKSGSSAPSSAWVLLISGADYYAFGDYGEHQWAQLYHSGPPEVRHNYPSDNDWHNYAWTRDSDGWWSLNIDDGPVEWTNFYQDNQMTSFDPIGIHVLRNQSDIEWVRISVSCEPEIEVDVDIKPRSCPNPLNVKSEGVLPVAILGSEDVNVTEIDVATIRLGLADPNVAPIRSALEDVAGPLPDGEGCECTIEGPDGFLDLTLKFNIQEIVEVLGEVNHGDELTLTLEGALLEEFCGTPIYGADCVTIRGKHKPLNLADINKDGVVDMADFAIMSGSWLESSVLQD